MLGFITGLASEADCLAASLTHGYCRIAGIGAGNAERGAHELIRLGCTRLISFGLAGGLSANLAPGSIVISETIVAPDGYAYPADAAYAARLLAGLPNAVRRPIAGSDTIIASTADKFTLQRRTHAVAVDMESHQVARVAHAAGLPFMAVRAIADPYDQALPRTALTAIGPDGRPDLKRVLSGLARRPTDLIPLLKLGMYSRKAHEALRGVAPLVIGSSERL